MYRYSLPLDMQSEHRALFDREADAGSVKSHDTSSSGSLTSLSDFVHSDTVSSISKEGENFYHVGFAVYYQRQY